MQSTHASRQKLASSNSQMLTPYSKSAGRNRTYEPRLFLKRVVGTTCTSPTGFDATERCFTYIAGGAVVVVDVQDAEYSQRFFRARPSATPVFNVTSATAQASPSPNATPKANDAKNRVAKTDWSDSSSLKTWTSRERIKAATCVSLSRDGRFLAVGETGYAPRVLIFSLRDTSSDRPLVSISEHDFGVRAIAWSQDGRYLASLGTANDGFLIIWRIDPRTGSAKLFQQNRCTSQVNGMIWLGNHLITFGTRHVRAWKIVDELCRPASPSKKPSTGDINPQNVQKTLPGRNVLLGSLIEASFTCGLALDENRALFCSDGGDICLLDDTTGQMRLSRVAELGFPSTCCSRRGQLALIAGSNGQLATFHIEALISDDIQDTIPKDVTETHPLAAMGYVQDQLITVNFDRSIEVWKAESLPGQLDRNDTLHVELPGHNEPLLGIQKLPSTAGTFLTWSASGRVHLWGLDGALRKSLHIAVDEVQTGNEMEPWNQLRVVRSDDQGNILAAGDRIGMLRVVDAMTSELLFATRAHTGEITQISVHHDSSRAIIVTCGRDRTVQIFRKISKQTFEHLQTLQYQSRVNEVLLCPDQRIITCCMDRSIWVHQLVCKIGEPDDQAAVVRRKIPIRASPTSVALEPDSSMLWASALDRTLYQFDLETGNQLAAYKCVDESGSETVVLDSLSFGSADATGASFLLGMSNTDKSIRMYDPNTGAFVDREWGHTESINGVALVEDDDGTRKAVSAGCDGTIMIWDLDPQDSPLGATNGSSSPVKGGVHGPNQQPPRRVLSEAELAEYQRPSSSSQGGRRSPPRTLRNRKSRTNLISTCASSAKTPTGPSHHHNSPSNASSVVGDSPSRRTSSSRSCSSPIDTSPKSRTLTRRPSLPALGATPSTNPGMRKKSSAMSLRSSYNFGSLHVASEQIVRQLKGYRQKMSSAEPLTPEMTAELENELRLTAAALGERRLKNIGSQQQQAAVTESVLSSLLDQYSDKLVAILDEKLRLRLHEASGGLASEEAQNLPRTTDEVQRRPRTACGTTQLVNS